MRVAVVSDIHANLSALEAVLADAGPVAETWCPGDIVGYGPSPNECIELLRGRGATCVAGNHDWAAIGRLSTVDFNPDAAAAARWTEATLTANSRQFLEGLPLTTQRGDFTIVHGTRRNPIWEYLVSPAQADDTLSAIKTRWCLVGHTHVPVVFLRSAPGQPSRSFDLSAGKALSLGGEGMVINPGSVGQPRDGIPEASYVLLDTEARRLEYRRVAYDIEQTQRLMQLHNLPARLWQRLAYGW